MKRGEAQAKLEALGIEWYCDLIIGGKSMTDVAKLAGVSMMSLLTWLRAEPARVRLSAEARELSAEAYVDRAESVIMGARNAFGLAKARELAQHFRWKATKIAPRDFGDKVGVEATGANGSPLFPDTMSKERRLVDGARRIAFILAQGAALTGPPKG